MGLYEEVVVVEQGGRGEGVMEEGTSLVIDLGCQWEGEGGRGPKTKRKKTAWAYSAFERSV